jgi:DNA-directed RNA polymerase specialized sigma24 family protein
VVLRYYEDLPVAEVAAVLGVGEGTVKRNPTEAMSNVAARQRRLPCRIGALAAWRRPG